MDKSIFTPVSKIPQQKVHMIGDGQCLFRGIAYHVYHDQNKYQHVRNDIANYVLSHDCSKIDVVDEKLESWILFDGHNSIKDYAEWVQTPFTANKNFYGGFLECVIASLVYNIRIVMTGNDIEPQVFGNNTDNTLYLDWNYEHFSVLVD